MIHSLSHSFGLPHIGIIIFCLCLLVRAWINPDPRRLMDDHVMYVSATLGMGKTGLAAHWAQQFLKPRPLFDRLLFRLARRPLPEPVPVYSTFVMFGCRPLDLRDGGWPTERGAKIIIDEILLLESNDLLPVEWFSRGCTLARQLEQQVVLISQASRLPNKLKKFQGTIGLFLTMKGFAIGKLGRVIVLKRASEPFIRRAKGFKADGQKKVIIFIPRRAFDSYISRKIYGYTVDTAGEWLDISMNASEGAAPTPVGQAATEEPPVSVRQQRPAWHRPGGSRGRSRKVRPRVL